jgi:hypothetical protein
MKRISLNVVGPRPNGAIIYRGPSMIDGAPIVAVIVGLERGSSNGKTGAMLQTYILADVPDSPVDVLGTPAERSICGDCPFMVYNGAGGCYVNQGQGPRAVHDALTRGIYPSVTGDDALADIGDGHNVRMGTYGDPLAVPAAVWTALISRAAAHTGYTHGWRKARAAAYRPFLMASVETEADGARARSKGWRTFRVKDAAEPVAKGEIVCPAAEEAGKRRDCSTCKACDGAGTNAGRVSIVIDAHGLAWKVRRYKAMRRARAQRKRYRVRAAAR